MLVKSVLDVLRDLTTSHRLNVYWVVSNPGIKIFRPLWNMKPTKFHSVLETSKIDLYEVQCDKEAGPLSDTFRERVINWHNFKWTSGTPLSWPLMPSFAFICTTIPISTLADWDQEEILPLQYILGCLLYINGRNVYDLCTASGSFLTCSFDEHTGAEIKWPPFRRRWLQIHSLECMNFDDNFTEVCS